MLRVSGLGRRLQDALNGLYRTHREAEFTVQGLGFRGTLLGSNFNPVGFSKHFWVVF